MTIGGPKGPTGPKPPIGAPADQVDRGDAAQKSGAAKADGPDFADALQGADASAAAQPTATGDALATLAASVDAGELSAQQAAEMIVERIVSARPGLDAAGQQRLREALLAQLDGDPHLAATLRSLEGGG